MSEKKRRIFISHSSLDKDYGQAVCNLFRAILPSGRLFFSSSETQGVPEDN